MPAIETTISTDRPQRYLTQIGQHAAALASDQTRHRAIHTDRESSAGRPELHVEASDERTLLTFTPWGRCTLTGSAGELHIRIEATDTMRADTAYNRSSPATCNGSDTATILLLEWRTGD